ncbi:hypothetical protein ABZ626_23390 [Streptomyces longispororuber]|uniref:hypothetical protein n=1 Tax=Streptomyces longispororuber TaxID=68230 RepID=UPI0033BFD392
MSDAVDGSVPAEAGIGSSAATGIDNSAQAPGNDAVAGLPLTYDELLAERDKWQREAEQFQTAAETSAEEARQAGRQAALSELMPMLVGGELRIQAQAENIEIPDLEYLNLASFMGEDGKPDTEVIKKFVATCPKKRSHFPQIGGAQINLNHSSGPFNPPVSLDARTRKR